MTSNFGAKALPEDSPAIRLLEENDPTGRGVYISHIDKSPVRTKMCVPLSPSILSYRGLTSYPQNCFYGPTTHIHRRLSVRDLACKQELSCCSRSRAERFLLRRNCIFEEDSKRILVMVLDVHGRINRLLSAQRPLATRPRILNWAFVAPPPLWLSRNGSYLSYPYRYGV